VSSVSSVTRADINLTFNMILIDVYLRRPTHRDSYSFPRLVMCCDQHQHFVDTKLASSHARAQVKRPFGLPLGSFALNQSRPVGKPQVNGLTGMPCRFIFSDGYVTSLEATRHTACRFPTPAPCRSCLTARPMSTTDNPMWIVELGISSRH
jgi:hypothetical protein